MVNPIVVVCAGSDKKHAAFLQRFEGVERLDSDGVEADGANLSSGSLRAEMKPTPWLLKAGLTPDQVRPYLLLMLAWVTPVVFPVAPQPALLPALPAGGNTR